MARDFTLFLQFRYNPLTKRAASGLTIRSLLVPLPVCFLLSPANYEKFVDLDSRVGALACFCAHRPLSLPAVTDLVGLVVGVLAIGFVALFSLRPLAKLKRAAQEM